MRNLGRFKPTGGIPNIMKGCWLTQWVLFFLMPAVLKAAGLVVQSGFDPDTIRVGEVTDFRITVEGDLNVAQPSIPAVDGLEVISTGQSTNMQFINGKMSGGVTFTFGILARKVGDITMPPITVGMIKTKPVQLHVKKADYVAPPPVSSSTVTATPTPPASGSGITSRSPSGESAWIELHYPKREFYVGELIPVELKVFIRQGLQIVKNTPPVFSGSAFTFTSLGKHEQTQTVLDGAVHYVYTWHPAISAVKPGEHPLGVQMDLTILVPRKGRGGFNDPFIDSFFNDAQQKLVSLTTPDTTQVKVLSLPTEGRPSDFSGAIGQFQLSVIADPKEINAGDPVTLKMIVSGKGNFDRVRAPELSKSTNYKAYPPSAKFDSTDETGYTGQKIFEQAIIPKSSEFKKIPEVTFDYFDPETRKYQTLMGSPIPIKVTGSTLVKPEPFGAGVKPDFSGGAGAGKAGSTELVPNKLQVGQAASALSPVLFGFPFWVLPVFSVTGLFVAWSLSSRQRRLKDDPQFARAISASKAIKNHLSDLDHALSKGDSRAFFMSGRKALQQRLGECLGRNPESITLLEVEHLLELQPELCESLRRFFDMADAVEYSGQNYSHDALAEWKKALLALLVELQKRRKA